MDNINRLKIYCKHEGILPNDYVELLEDIEKNPQIMYLEGTDYHNADTLAMWGFVQKIMSPIFSKDDVYIGNNVGYCSVFCKLKHVESTNKPF